MSVITRLFRQAPPSPPANDEPPPPDPVVVPAADTAQEAANSEIDVAAITDETQLGELALRGATPAIRRQAAERIHSREMLGRLLKDAQGKDKHVYRILKTKRDAIHAAERAAAEALAAVQTLCGTIERHSHQPFSDTYASTVAYLSAQWQAAAERAPEKLRAVASAALTRCGDTIARHEQQVAAAAAHAVAQDSAAAAYGMLLAAVRSLLADVYANAAPDAVSVLAGHRASWQENAAVRAPEKAGQKEFDRLCSAVESLLEFNSQFGSVTDLAATLTEDHAAALQLALRHLDLLGDDQPPAALTAAAALQAWHEARAAEREAAANAQRQAVQLLRKAQSALAGGNSRQAAGMRRALEDKLQALPTLPPHLAGQLQEFDTRLAALQDWRSYAVAPKRTELIEQMEALIGSTEAPQALADQIRRLQEEWKLISKGSTEDTTAEWERFHAASQQAYEPCKIFFAAQAQLRADNLARRAALIDRLQAFVSAQTWEGTDWRSVAKALRESRQQWRTHQPVERAAGKPLQERFDALSSELQSHLDTEYQRNTAAKRGLIDQAQALNSAADPRQAAEDIKRLQLTWREIGLVPPEMSQQLWEEFRQHCDAVFSRRQQHYVEQSAQLAASQSQAVALCEEAEALAQQSGQALIEAMKRLSALRESFDDLGELPRDAARALRSRLEQAADKCARQLAQQRADAQLAAWDRVLEAGDCIRRYQLARLQGLEPDACTTPRQAAETLLGGDTPWPKGALQLLKTALAAAGPADLAANETALRTLCIRAELLTGVPTPEADLPFRRAYQLQELARGFGQARDPDRDAPQALLLEWVGVGATSDAVYAELFERLTRCRESGTRR